MCVCSQSDDPLMLSTRLWLLLLSCLCDVEDTARQRNSKFDLQLNFMALLMMMEPRRAKKISTDSHAYNLLFSICQQPEYKIESRTTTCAYIVNHTGQIEGNIDHLSIFGKQLSDSLVR